MTTRFEQYVRETIVDATKARRDGLKAAVEAAKADLDAKVKACEDVADEACAEADRKVRALAKKWGWRAVPGSEGTEKIVQAGPVRNNLSNTFAELHSSYSCVNDVWRDRYVDGPVAAAQRALDEFDAAVDKAVRRLVVVKKDLGMKAEAFDKAVADAVAKLLK